MATDTIVAISTPAGRGAIGIVRASGPRARDLATGMLGFLPEARRATFSKFHGCDGQVIDEGIALFMPAPGSYTGEDTCEFHGHGSTVSLHRLLDTLCALGGRPARPGEFSERAFRNGRIDLAQAEAIADLIDARSERAARSAMRTLQGEFSERVGRVVTQLTTARIEVEGAIDFPDDISGDELVTRQTSHIEHARAALRELIARARQGARLNEGAVVAIVGAPNTGKSTLMNRLAGRDKSIVSEIPGTTRDIIEVEALLRDLPVRLYDTAGLRTGADPVEAEGIRRALRVTADADMILLVTDDPAVAAPAETFRVLAQPLPERPILVVHNKIDLYGRAPQVIERQDSIHVFISARDDTGIDLLLETLTATLGIEAAEENEFVARTRHLVALRTAADELDRIEDQVLRQLPELAAESLRRAANSLGEITGAYSSDDLLGEIFSRFCIGK